uniref:3-dehydroquinate synthase N-terminal domain-containing protein n=1 Tax=Lactuca sativa TaxID=4236 RepID=A0A9R1W6E6_LACSA|nr:hypothetical protein LSAT_V11C300141810 [Lactuca sativa]
MISNTERRRKPLLLTTKTPPPSIFTLTDALKSQHLRSSTIMAINDPEHREEEEAAADDEDIGARVAPIARLEAIEVINGVKILEIANTGMATISPSSPPSSPFITITGNLTTHRLINCAVRSNCGKCVSRFRSGVIVTMSMEKKNEEEVWIWTENKQVMTAAIEKAIALINPIFIEDKSLFDNKAKLVATISEISSPQELEQLQSAYEHADNIIVDLLDWQVIPAENIVAAFHGTHKTVFAISKGLSESQIFLETVDGVSKIKDGYNPATWMLEVSTSAQELTLGGDISYEQFLRDR